MPCHYRIHTPGAIVACRLLDRVESAELLGDAVREQFRPFAERHGLSPDVLLLDYSVEVMDSARTLLTARHYCQRT